MKFLKLIFAVQALLLSASIAAAVDLTKQRNAAEKIQKFYRSRKEPANNSVFKKIFPYNPDDYTIAFNEIIIACGDDNFPTTKALEQLMINYYFSVTDQKTGVKTLQPDIEKKLTITRVDKGLHCCATDALYSVKISEKVIFILKLVNDFDCQTEHGREEVEKLINVQKSAIARIKQQGRHFIGYKYLPTICWVEDFFVYKDIIGMKRKKKGRDPIRKHVIEVLHAAQGKSIDEFTNTPDAMAAAVAWGKSLAAFQQVFMDYGKTPEDVKTWRTYAHADLHYQNVFFDPKTSRIYFIDNSLCNPNEEIFTDLNKAFFYAAKLDKNANTGKFFLQAYLELFPADKRKLLKNYLIAESERIF